MESNFPDLMVMLVNVGRVVPTFIMLAQVVAIFIGVYLTGTGLIELWGANNENYSKHMSSQRAYSTGGGLISVFLGAILLSLGTLELIGIFSRTITGDFSTARMTAESLSYSPGQSSTAKEKAQAATLAMLALMQAVGFVALVKSVLTVNRYYKQMSSPASISTAITWAIGGTLAWNFKWFADVLNNTIGFDIISLFSSIN